MDEQQVRDIIRQELQGLLGSDRFTFRKNIQLLDGRNMVLGKATGSTIGQTTSKLGFYGHAPVSQQTAVTTPNAPGSSYSQSEAQTAVTAIIQMQTRLTNLGLTM